jgi:hypothetical protein
MREPYEILKERMQKKVESGLIGPTFHSAGLFFGVQLK